MMNMEFSRKLTIPMETKKMYPITEDMQRTIDKRRQEIMDVFSGKSKKLLLALILKFMRPLVQEALFHSSKNI